MAKYLLLILIFLSFPAMAQESERQVYAPGSTFKNEDAELIRSMKRDSLSQKGIITPKTIQVELVKHDYMDENQFGILLSVPDVVSGCFNITPLEYEASFIDTYYFDIKVKHYQRTPIDTQNVNECPNTNKMSTALIVLSRKDLQDKQIRQIRFSGGMVADYYDVRFTENTMELIPQSMVTFKAKSLEGPLEDRMVFRFRGANRIALHVPMAKTQDRIAAQIQDFARSKGLKPDQDTPMSTGYGGKKIYYFYDEGDSLLQTIGPDGYALVGNITVSRQYDGPNGREYVGMPLQVYATKPGTQL